MYSTEEDKKRARPRRKLLPLATGVLLLLALFLLGFLPRYRRQKVVEAAARSEVSSLPAVNVAKVRSAPGTAHLLLPGNITPITEAYLYARASGYVRRRTADIGDRVRAGQVLAEIESPDLDQQVMQGRAALSQAEQQLGQAEAQLSNSQAQEDLARVTWERYKVLVSHGAISRQDADQQFTAWRSAQANVNAQQANVRSARQNVEANRANLDRLKTLQAFELVKAPFAGVVTARTFDIGALISGSGASLGNSPNAMGGTQVSGSSGNNGLSGGAGTGVGASPGGELYRIAQIGVLRILVNVPQEEAPTIRVGRPADVTVQEYPQRVFDGKVTRTANALDPVSRTLLTEVQVVNSDSVLLPGMYAQVRFSEVRVHPPLLIPGDSLIATADGLRVAILRDRRVHLQPVEVGRDYGTQIEVVKGLAGWEYVVVNPGDNVQEGVEVNPRQAPGVEGQNASRHGAPSAHPPAGISAPSREAPTGGKAGKGGGQ